MGLERRRSGAVGARRGVVDLEVDLEGRAMRTEVRVVERGMDAERRARREVWRRWGRRGRV